MTNTRSIRICNLGDCNLVCYDKTHGRGCDVILECSSLSGDKRVIIAEVKRCKITLEDALVAAEQINECLSTLKSAGTKTTILKYLVHDHSNGCSIHTLAMEVLKRHNIRYLPTWRSQRPLKERELAREIVEKYYSNCK